MSTLEELTSRIRAFKRSARLLVTRTTTPKSGEDFFVKKDGTNALEITNLKFTWAIDRDLSKHPSRCEIEIYNLAPDTRAALETDPLHLELSAGHDGVMRLVFAGDKIDAYSRQEGADKITKLTVGDGTRAVTRARVRPRAYKRGTTARAVIADICQSLGQTVPKNLALNPELDAQISSGDVLTGFARDELTRILAPHGYGWSFQNGRLQILRDNDTRSDLFVIDEQAGMLDSPKYAHPPKSGKPPSLEIRTLLYPELVPGGKVTVRSLGVNGEFKLVKVKHSGDTEGDDWFTDVELKPL